MLLCRIIASALPFSLWLLNLSSVQSAELGGGTANERIFAVRGVVRELAPAGGTIVIQHEAITNFMDAMTMPFQVKGQRELAGFKIGDAVAFQLHVTGTASWVDQIKKMGATSPPSKATSADYAPATTVDMVRSNPLLYYRFTNELGQAVSLNDFQGQALGITFFYTRCPLPEYCPRLSKNFQEASQRLAAMTNSPANWHFISITFDPAADTPSMLKAYGESYRYDPHRWSFLTGPPDRIAGLARSCGVEFTPDAGAINHNFRTLIIDASGHLQMVFPTSGDLSDQIAAEMIKAAGVTNTGPITAKN
jgi:protein SCO1/2